MKMKGEWAFPDADEFMLAELKEDGTYQSSHLTAALEHVKQFRIAVDVGAHVGTWSKPMSASFDGVYAFEPSLDTFAALERNLATFHCANVTPVHMALGARQMRGRMTLEGHERAIASLNTGARYLVPGDEVMVSTLDSFDLSFLDFLKIDAEGSEPDILLGAKDTLLRCRPVVLFEDKNFWSRFGYARHAPHDLLTEFGAVKLQRVGCDEIWGWPTP